MPPQFFVKFQYTDRIKKIGLTEDEFTWDNMCKILSQSFSLPKDRLKLTYKDPEGDEITACCDEDLIEAYKACSSLQPMRFFVYLCSNAPFLNRSASVKKEVLHSSKGQEQEEPKERTLEELKVKSESVISDVISMPEKERPLSEGIIKSPDASLQAERQVKVGAEEIGRILEEILLTKEAKEKILQLRKLADNNDTSNTKYVVGEDQNILADCVANIFSKVLNETIAINIEDKVQSLNSITDILGDNTKKMAISKDWKSMEEEKTQQNLKSQPASEGNLFNMSLKESIYEKSGLSPVKDTKSEDLKEKSFAGTSMSFCRDLSSTYGVKLALRFENGKMKLMSVPTQEYSIIDSIENPQKERSESDSLLKRSASMNQCPDPKKNSPQDYSEYFRLSLVD